LSAALAIFIIFPLILRKRYMARMRGSGGSGFGLGGGGFFGQGQSSGVKYVCLTCNHRFKGGDCPRCGSKMKRADF
jgi:rubrerythrin